MSQNKIAIFDIIGTCFSLEKPSQELVALGAPPQALQFWFAQSLRDAFALSHAGGYQPLKDVLAAELPRSLQMLGIEVTADQSSQILSTFKELDLQPSALEAFQILQEAGWTIIALTNGSEDSTRQLLDRADALQYFSQIFSCDLIQKTKPHPAVYALPQEKAEGTSLWMVAAHAWDIAGAARAGLRTAFITQSELSYLSIYPQPDLIASDLVEAARQMAAETP